MLSVSSTSLASSQPVSRHPPKTPDEKVAEAEAQWIFTDEELASAPSIVDGMKPEEERELRSKGLNFIVQVGAMLKLPQLTLSTAGIFFNRFLMRHSLVNVKDSPKPLHHYQIAAVSLFLATKVEENSRKTREIIVACCRVAQKNPSLILDENSKDWWRWRDTLLMNEDILLETLCFDLSVETPHKLVFDLLKRLNAQSNKALRNAAWGFLNDASLTSLCLRFTSRAIAASAIYAAAKHTTDTPPFPDDVRGRPWWEAYAGVTLLEIKRACNFMADLFEHGPTDDPSIYVGLRTPVDALDHDDTMLKSDSSVQTHPDPTDIHEWQRPSLMGTEIAGLKRNRDGTPRVENPAGSIADESAGTARKRLDGNSAPAEPFANGGATNDDEGSEEGEVEE